MQFIKSLTIQVRHLTTVSEMLEGKREENWYNLLHQCVYFYNKKAYYFLKEAMLEKLLLKCKIYISVGRYALSWSTEHNMYIQISVRAWLVTSVVSDSLRPNGPWPTRLLCPWDSPGKNTGVGCHFLLQ